MDPVVEECLGTVDAIVAARTGEQGGLSEGAAAGARTISRVGYASSASDTVRRCSTLLGSSASTVRASISTTA